MNQRVQGGPTPQQINAMKEQQIVNARILALKHARNVIGNSNFAGKDVDAGVLVEQAKIIEKYITEGLSGLKKESAIVMQANMPPPGAFKPGA